jgi:hypothetical protein
LPHNHSLQPTRPVRRVTQNLVGRAAELRIRWATAVNTEEEDERLGRGARLSGGVLFLLLGAISGLTVFVVGAVATETREYVLCAIAATISFACLFWAIRLLLNRPRRDGGLLSPIALVLFGVVYAGLPIAALLTGAWRNNQYSPVMVALQGCLYLSWGVAMFRLAVRRHRARQ